MIRSGVISRVINYLYLIIIASAIHVVQAKENELCSKEPGEEREETQIGKDARTTHNDVRGVAEEGYFGKMGNF